MSGAINPPLWKLQIQLAGGASKIVTIVTVYVAVACVAAFGWRRLAYGVPLNVVTATMLSVLAGLQSAFLVLGGANAIYRALLRDYQTRMSESHRLSPMSATSMALGYLLGAAQPLALAAVNLPVGVVLCFLSDFPVSRWLIANGCLLVGALNIWMLVIINGVGLTKPLSPAGAVVLLGLAGAVCLPIPVLGVFTSAYACYVGGGLVWGTITPSQANALVIVPVQCVLIGLWLWLAVRRYRRPDLPVFNALGGSLLVLLWVTIGCIGIRVAATDPSLSASLGSELLIVQWVTTILTMLAVLVWCIAGTVECRLAIDRGREPRGPTDRVNDLVYAVLAPVVAVAICFAIVVGEASERIVAVTAQVWKPHAATMATLVLAAVTARGVLTFFLSRSKPSRVTGLLIVALLWLLPMIAEPVRFSYAIAFDQTYAPTPFFAGSPIGAVLACWAPPLAVRLDAGLAIQLALALVANMWFAQLIRPAPVTQSSQGAFPAAL